MSLVTFRRCAIGLKKVRFISVGPPDPVSNLRKYKYILPANASALEKRLYEEQEAVQKWNEEFWTKHNTEFVKKREAFIQKELSKKSGEVTNLNADEISVFYKQFLDENWKRHLIYNFTWYKKNIDVTFLYFKVKLSRLFNRK